MYNCRKVILSKSLSLEKLAWKVEFSREFVNNANHCQRPLEIDYGIDWKIADEEFGGIRGDFDGRRHCRVQTSSSIGKLGGSERFRECLDITESAGKQFS